MTRRVGCDHSRGRPGRGDRTVDDAAATLLVHIGRSDLDATVAEGERLPDRLAAPGRKPVVELHNMSTRTAREHHDRSVASRDMRVTMILPALTEATSTFFRPIKYSL